VNQKCRSELTSFALYILSIRLPLSGDNLALQLNNKKIKDHETMTNPKVDEYIQNAKSGSQN